MLFIISVVFLVQFHTIFKAKIQIYVEKITNYYPLGHFFCKKRYFHLVIYTLFCTFAMKLAFYD